MREASKTSEEAASLLNVSPRSVESAAKVLRDGAPELQVAVDRGDVAVSTAAIIAEAPPERQAEIVARGEKEILAAAKEIKAKKAEEKMAVKREVAAQIAAEPPPLPAVGPFRVIAIDPPWRYEARVEDPSHRGRNPYPDMTQGELLALPVRDLAHEDAVLWLWTTNAFMGDALELVKAWGFTAKTILTWDKQLLGLGDWLRNVTEHCILAVRGRPVVTLTNQTTLISEKRREHSRKPDAFYALVETLCPGSKLEMFARASRDGWATWGAESQKFDDAAA